MRITYDRRSSIVFPFQASPPGIPAIDAAFSFAMAALFGRCFHRNAPFLVTINTPETLAMGTGDINIRHVFNHGLQENYGNQSTLKVIER